MKSTEDSKIKDVDAPVVPAEKPVATNSHGLLGDKEKMKQNRKKLGVEEDHKTKEMEKSKRGTFP